MDQSARIEELRRRKREAEHGPDPERAMPPEHINFWAEYEAKHQPEPVPKGAPFGAKTTEWYTAPQAQPSARDSDVKATSDPLNAMNAYLYEKERRRNFFRDEQAGGARLSDSGDTGRHRHGREHAARSHRPSERSRMHSAGVAEPRKRSSGKHAYHRERGHREHRSHRRSTCEGTHRAS